MAAFRTSLRLARHVPIAPARVLPARAAIPAVRAFSTGAGVPKPEAPKNSNSSILFVLALAAVGVSGYFLVDEPTLASWVGLPDRTTGKGGLAGEADYQKVYNAIANLLENEKYDDGSYGPVLVRLAWHSSGTYDKETNTGGSNGATMRYPLEAGDGANAGLEAARNLLEPLKKKFPWISYSDLWTLGGVAAIQELGGPVIPWRPGRQDAPPEKTPPNGRLPDAAQGAQHLRNVFYRMGFNDQEIVALSGGHVLGRCHPNRSGFDGPWTFSPISFTNDFFNLLVNEKWEPKKWDGPFQWEDVGTHTLMMLPTDYALIEDASFKKTVQKYAKDEELFFKDFASVFSRLLELGVPAENFDAGAKGLEKPGPLTFKTTAEQENSK
ncbi:cytochrome-c peroxidase [Malassezia cuniculi]|uniref:Peroxidase n=1 Tax=Malassezia cuniculi TaxID=948313 RepID=A0AAF0F180_9BASI|nr:cytochrome-c peroxidase [Malassezia cuniculi]